MDPTRGSFKLFRLAGVDVYMHWLWLPFVFLIVGWQPATYDWPIWKAVEYVGLFGSVLAHEFGHALACRSVGGTARTIVLWPLGGIAYVAPPPRPGAVLWSIAAGPLVNLALVIPFGLLALAVSSATWPDLRSCLAMLALLNFLLFLFNLVPAYPLDGGQILHALLWFHMGRWPALQATTAVGVILGVFLLVGSVVMVPLAASVGGDILFPMMLGFIAAFMALQSAAMYKVARHIQQMEALPRRTDCACPSCFVPPPTGSLWVCDECGQRFDMFETRGKCPGCGAWYLQQTCMSCRATSHIDRWFQYLPGVGLAPLPEETDEART